MTEFEKLKEKYDKLIRESLDKNKEIIIDSFALYYGEEYRSIIEKRYNKITFVYYIDWAAVDFVMTELPPKKKYEDFRKFNNARKDIKLSNKLMKKIKGNKLPDNLIGTTNPLVLNDKALLKTLNKFLSLTTPCCFSYGNVKNRNRMITFQILSLDENTIIHEINHAITRDELAYVMDGQTTIGPVEKIGLCIDGYHNNRENKIEELLNEKSSEEITKIFKSKGGDFSSFCLSLPITYFYKHNFYLIDEFYKQFKEYIKIARISENKNELIKRVGEDVYMEFYKLVNECFTSDISQINTIKKKALPRINKLIELMKQNEEKSCESKEDKLKSDIEQLKSQGYNVRVLDYSYNETEDLSNEEDNNIQRR